jgi:predicted nucleotidyltransferase
MPVGGFRMRADQRQLDELVRRIVEAVHPQKIILFGSAARGEIGPDSDVDVMVVMPEGTHRLRTSGYLHTQLSGIPFPVDIVIATETDLKRYADDIGFIYRRVLKEGKQLYAAA